MSESTWYALKTVNARLTHLTMVAPVERKDVPVGVRSGDGPVTEATFNL